MSNLRAGVVGVGVMGANHVRVLSNLEGVDLIGVVDSQKKELSPLVTAKRFSNIMDLLDAGLDYCVIATPTVTHEKVAMELISRGVNVLIEKPLSSTYSSAQKIASAAHEAQILGAVGHIERFNMAVVQAKEKIDEGKLGEIYQIATRRQGPYPGRINDVGVVSDLATHDIDITAWISGQNYSKISAFARNRFGKSQEDLVTINGLLSEGIVVNHIVNWLSPIKERKIIITGERGTLVIDTLKVDLKFYENGQINISNSHLAHFRGVTLGEIHTYAFEKPEPLLIEHLNFKNSLLNFDNKNVSLNNGAETVRVADAVIKSLQNKELVHL